ncbi:MAG: amidohydrolase family protein, partial [Spirochaetia bacterium]|nr:amidohydrolase family protein [Spirochaetia bacterium]
MSSSLFAKTLLWGPDLEIRNNQVVHIDNGLIISIKPGTMEEADTVIAPSQVLMPGLVDCHTHLALDAR